MKLKTTGKRVQTIKNLINLGMFCFAHFLQNYIFNFFLFHYILPFIDEHWLLLKAHGPFFPFSHLLYVVFKPFYFRNI